MVNEPIMSCGCKILPAGRGIILCPLHLAASRLLDALTNLKNTAVLLARMQRAGTTISPEILEALADICKVARDALAQVKPESGECLQGLTGITDKKDAPPAAPPGSYVVHCKTGKVRDASDNLKLS